MELPTGMPWYFAGTIVGVWLAAVFGIYRVALVLRGRRRERRPTRPPRRIALGPPRSDDE